MKVVDCHQRFVCDDCHAPFSVHVPLPKRKRVFCPLCGENTATRKYQSERTNPDSKKKLRWSAAEVAVLAEVKSGGLSPIQAALKLGRSPNSVMKKLSRI